ncbi:Vacuolar amino acid transporter 3 [Diplonema papillatum]|nr:Vacuolar amino acid transporter 3 [Diplonema papillatum]|eukprot:gene1044-1611_t
MGVYTVARSASAENVAGGANERAPLNPLDATAAYGEGGAFRKHEQQQQQLLQQRPLTLPADFSAVVPPRPKSVEQLYIANLAAQTPSQVGTALEPAGVTNFQAFLLVFKSFIGTGILVLPKAFVNGGLLASGLFMAFVALMNTYVMIKLSSVKDYIGEGTLQDIGFRAGGKYVYGWVCLSVVFIQVAAGCMYLIFMGQTLKSVVQQTSNCADWAMDVGTFAFILSLIIVVTPLVWIRQVRHFAIPALIADVLIVVGLAYIFVYANYKISEDGAQDFDLFNPSDFSIYLGTVLFSFEGVCLVLPIKSSMRNPLDYPKVLASVMLCLLVIYVGFSTVNYLAHGKDVETAVILELPQNSTPVLVVQVAYVIAIALTFPLQFFPAVQCLEAFIWPPSLYAGAGGAAQLWKENLFRFCLVCVAAGIAIVGSTNFDHFTALGGALFSMPLLFVFPPLFHYLLMPDLPLSSRVINISIIVLGCCLSVFSTVLTLYDWFFGDADDTNIECTPR